MTTAVELERPAVSVSHDEAETFRAVQQAWSQIPILHRLAVLSRARQTLAACSVELCASISTELARTTADTLVAEVLPLLDACRFLERRAPKILATRKLGRRGRSLWLAEVDSQVERVPFGHILVFGPANYPLFLPGVQTLQALAAGNAVVWKPGRGGRAVAQLFASVLIEAGLPSGLLVVTEETVVAGRDAIAGRVNGVAPDKVIFTGSAVSGRAILRQLAETLTPSVMELSGCDAVIVLPSADRGRVVKALVLGMRLNGSATCMAPRRLVLVGMSMTARKEFVELLAEALDTVRAVELSLSVRQELTTLVESAVRDGAELIGEERLLQKPLLLTGVSPDMDIAQTDIFAPVLMVMHAESSTQAEGLVNSCGYALTVTIFGEEREARAIGAKVTAGTVIINDVIVPTADARVPFGGRRKSGFGATRGAEGLLEMTAAKTIAVRRGRSVRHYEATGPEHVSLFAGLILATHASTWAQRWNGMKQVVAAARKMN